MTIPDPLPDIRAANDAPAGRRRATCVKLEPADFARLKAFASAEGLTLPRYLAECGRIVGEAGGIEKAGAMLRPGGAVTADVGAAEPLIAAEVEPDPRPAATVEPEPVGEEARPERRPVMLEGVAAWTGMFFPGRP